MTSQPTPPAPDGGIDGGIAGLDDLDAVPVTEHVARFHALHESCLLYTSDAADE